MNNVIMLWFFSCVFQGTDSPNQPKCRDRSGYHKPAVFKLRTCAMCYEFLFHRESPKLVAIGVWMATWNYTYNVPNYVVQPDISKEENVQTVCATLSDNQCKRWLACCEDAVDCCDEQIRQRAHDKQSANACPATWDGFTCWDSTAADSMVTTNCPAFIDDHAMPSGIQ